MGIAKEKVMRSWSEDAAVLPEDEHERTLVASLWGATRRYNLGSAPNGLALVQDFLNTRASVKHGPDLLDDGRSAQAWADTAVWGWSRIRELDCRAPELTDIDAGRLRQLRDMLDGEFDAGFNTDSGPSGLDASVDLAWRGGEVLWMPAGEGWRWFYSVIMGEVLIAQVTQQWSRVKQCRNQECRATLFDRSWDKRQIWHDSRTRT
jgi:hypothetical protein